MESGMAFNVPCRSLRQRIAAARRTLAHFRHAARIGRQKFSV